MSERETGSPFRPFLSPAAKLPSPSVLDLRPESRDPYAHLRAWGRIISKRGWTVLATALLVATLAAIYSYRQKPVYRATAEVEVDSETPGVQSVNSAYATLPTDPTFLQTQVDVLTSSKLAWQTIRQLKLDRDPAFNPPASGGPPRLRKPFAGTESADGEAV